MIMPPSSRLAAQNEDLFDCSEIKSTKIDKHIDIISQQTFEDLRSGEFLNNFNNNTPKFLQTLQALNDPQINKNILMLMRKDCYTMSKQIEEKDPNHRNPETLQKLFRIEIAKQIINKELGIIPKSIDINRDDSVKSGTISFKAIISDFNNKVKAPWTCEEDLDTFLLPYLLDEAYLNRIIGVFANKIGEPSTSVLEACTLDEFGKKLAYPLNQDPLPYIIAVNASANIIQSPRAFSDDKLDVEDVNPSVHAIYDRDEAERKVKYADGDGSSISKSNLKGGSAAAGALIVGASLGLIRIPTKHTLDITSLLYSSGEPANKSTYKQIFDVIDIYNQKLLETRPLLISQYLNNLLHKKAYDERDEQEALIAAKEKLNEHEVEITRKYTDFEEYDQKKVEVKKGFDLRRLFGRSKSESSKTPNPYASEKAILKSYKERLALQEAKHEVEKDFLKMYKAAMAAMLIKMALNHGQISANEILDACRKRKIKDVEL